MSNLASANARLAIMMVEFETLLYIELEFVRIDPFCCNTLTFVFVLKKAGFIPGHFGGRILAATSLILPFLLSVSLQMILKFAKN